MKAQLLTVCALALVLALSGVDAGKRENKPARWLNMTVDTVRHDNTNPSDVHLADVQSVFTFCVPVAHRPYGDKYVATMTFFVDGPADLLAVDFFFSEETVDYIHKEPVTDGKVTIELHNYDGQDFFGWDGKMMSQISGAVYSRGASVPRVKFGGLALWEDAADLTCEKFVHTNDPEETQVDDEEEEPSELDTNKVHINVDVTYLNYYGISRRALRICMFMFAGFIASLVFICCCCHINTHMEEYDELSRMEEQLQMNDTAYEHPVADDDEALIRRVQEESLREYNMRQQQAPQYNPEQQQYMRVPVMSPELYAQYLRAAQAQQQM